MKPLQRILGCVLLIQPVVILAALPHAPSDAEVAQLPSFCAVKFQRPGPNFEPQFGRNNWIHMHHYCHGLKFVNRARNYPKERREYLSQAKGEYQYVFRTTEATFWFRPQMYLEMARIHLQLRERSDAQKWLSEAIKLNPRYEPAYIALIRLLMEDGARTTALEFASQGVRYLPRSEAIKKAYLGSGGKMPFPDPVVESPTTAQPTADVVEDARKEATATRGEGAGESVEAESTPTTGCRFCPPEDIQKRWRETFEVEE